MSELGRVAAAHREIADALLEVDVAIERLRADPRGESWLPVPLRRRIADTVGGEDVLREHVETELALFDGAGLAPDPWFAEHIIRSLPHEDPMAHGSRRRAILTAAHGLALVVGVVIAWPWLTGIQDALAGDGLAALARVDPTHGWLEALQAGGAASVVALGAVTLALALPFRGRERVRSAS
jgi:hypothetical protein